MLSVILIRSNSKTSVLGTAWSSFQGRHRCTSSLPRCGIRVHSPACWWSRSPVRRGTRCMDSPPLRTSRHRRCCCCWLCWRHFEHRLGRHEMQRQQAGITQTSASDDWYKPKFHYTDFHRNFPVGKVVDTNHESRRHKRWQIMKPWSLGEIRRHKSRKSRTQTISTCRDVRDKVRDKSATNPFVSL